MSAAETAVWRRFFSASKATIAKQGPVWRAAARLAGYAITVLACVYVADKIVTTGLFRQPIWLDARLWAWLTGLAIAYATSQILLAVAWMALLNATQVHVPFRHGAAIYLRMVVLKYLPSNLLHIAGRYGLTLKAGATHVALLRATLGELALQLVAGVVVATAFVFPLLSKILIDFIGSTQAWLVGGAFISALASLALLVRYWAVSRANLIPFLAPSTTAFLCYLAFFVAAGAILAALHHVLGPPSLADGFIGLLGLNAMAWVAGFIVPGAPAGLGVRENVLIAGLSAGTTEAGLALVIGYRIVTVIGDVIATLAGFFIPINQTWAPPIAEPVQAKDV
jgi:glycosyltransferase 2 family protein